LENGDQLVESVGSFSQDFETSIYLCE